MKAEIVIGIAGLCIGVATTAITLGYQIYTDREEDPTIVEKESKFYCALQASPTGDGDVWTVMYQNVAETKPWLRMVRAMGENWDKKERCDAISNRLNTYRKDGLLSFEYRDAPNLPGQYIICARTQVSTSGCPEVLTLSPEDDPYQALYEVASALLPGRLPSYQCNDEAICPVLEPTTIKLKNYLSDSAL
ncbi:MAG: COP23 domain-containing protein [Cyanobacteria bacterium J06598_3]